MTISSDHRIGKFYKFKPRSKWPLDAQTTLPDDKLYYIHPVIILSLTPTGLATVVTTTSHPRLEHGINAHVPIGFSSPLLPSEPLVINRPLPKASYVCLDSRRTFSIELFVPFVSEGKKGGQFELSNESKERLVRIVDESERGLYGKDLPPPMLEWTPELETQAVASTKPSKKTKKKAKKAATAAAVRAVSTTAATPQPHATDEKPMNVQDIKYSLSGLKLAVAALEALCEKLEANAPAVLPTKVMPSVRAVEPVMISGGLCSDHDPNISHVAPKTSEMVVTGDEECAEGDLSSSTRTSKRHRIEKWFSKLWKKRTGLNLASM